ncbi:MAG: molybdopterin-binding protein, partial [Plesiomonas shigelloides]
MSTPLRVEMISTGNEVLHGEIIDSNAAWLAQTLYQAGLPLAYRSTVGDDINALVSCFLARSHEADIV